MDDFLKIPPHSIEAEWSVLGGLLIDNDAIDRIAFLEPWHFYNHANHVLFTEIRKMLFANQPADIVTVLESLGDRANDVGGLAYIGSLVQNIPSAANIRRYAEIVKEKALLRDLLAASNQIADLAWDGEMDAGERINRAQSLVMKITEGATREPVSIGSLLASAIDVIERRVEKKADGLMTGLKDLDAALNGLKPGDLVYIGGRPSMGKSVLGFQFAVHCAMEGTAALVLSQEMSYQQIADRLLASVGRIGLSGIVKGELDNDDWDRITLAVGRLHEIPLYLDDQGALTLADVRAKARMQKRKNNIGILVVDYLQLMSGTGDNRNSVVEEISRGLKSIGKELQIPVVALTQLNRKCEERTNKRPMLSDLRDSGSVEQDADVVLFVYRDEMYNPDSHNKGVAEIIITKHRQGKTGMVPLAFNGEHSRFDDLMREYKADEAQRFKRRVDID